MKNVLLTTLIAVVLATGASANSAADRREWQEAHRPHHNGLISQFIDWDCHEKESFATQEGATECGIKIGKTSILVLKKVSAGLLL